VSIERDGSVYVGAAALDRLATHPSETVTSFKRSMGTQRTVRLGNQRDYSPEDLSALVLASLRDDVIAATGEAPTEAVITVPAYFNDRQRKATRRAGELAGLTVKRLINEPTAEGHSRQHPIAWRCAGWSGRAVQVQVRRARAACTHG
jgi:molecular chaperone HscC